MGLQAEIPCATCKHPMGNHGEYHGYPHYGCTFCPGGIQSYGPSRYCRCAKFILPGEQPGAVRRESQHEGP